MCDYSLHGIQNRLAVEGEILVVHRFHTGSKGLTSPRYLKTESKSKGLIGRLAEQMTKLPGECAVCIPDGAQLVVNVPQDLQTKHKLEPIENVTFRQLTDKEQTHRDAFGFENGQEVSLQMLEEGTRVQLLFLSKEAQQLAQEERKASRRVRQLVSAD